MARASTSTKENGYGYFYLDWRIGKLGHGERLESARPAHGFETSPASSGPRLSDHGQQAGIAVTTVILDDSKASIEIGGAAGAKLTVAKTLAIEEGTFGIGGLGTLDAAHIRIAAPKGSKTPTNGVLWFPGSGTINATVVNNGTIKAEGAAGSTVEFEREVMSNGTGSADISGGGTLEFAKKVVQNIDFGTGGGTLQSARPHGL